MGPRDSLDRCRNARTYRDSIPGSTSQLRVTIPIELFRLHVLSTDVKQSLRPQGRKLECWYVGPRYVCVDNRKWERNAQGYEVYIIPFKICFWIQKPMQEKMGGPDRVHVRKV